MLWELDESECFLNRCVLKSTILPAAILLALFLLDCLVFFFFICIEFNVSDLIFEIPLLYIFYTSSSALCILQATNPFQKINFLIDIRISIKTSINSFGSHIENCSSYSSLPSQKALHCNKCLLASYLRELYYYELCMYACAESFSNST
jgi:hypothetical protein